MKDRTPENLIKTVMNYRNRTDIGILSSESTSTPSRSLDLNPLSLNRLSPVTINNWNIESCLLNWRNTELSEKNKIPGIYLIE